MTRARALNAVERVSGHDGPSAAGGRLAARVVICLALLIEVQTPKLDGTYRLNIAIFAFLALLLLFLRARQAADSLAVAFSGSMAFLTTYCVWCLGTIMWSQNPSDTFLDGTLLLVTLGIAVSYSQMPAIVFAQEFVKVSAFLAGLSWLMLLTVPKIAVLPDVTWRLNGPMQHSQRLALVMGAALVVLTVATLYKRASGMKPGATVFTFLLLVTTLLATQTRAFTAFAFIAVWLLAFGRAKGRHRVLLVIGMTLAVLAAVRNTDKLLAAFERDGSNTFTLTGRTVIWENSLELIRENPLLGYGFSSFYSDLTRYFFDSGYIPPHAHNSWINAAFETGLVGALLLTLFMLATLRYGSISRPTFASSLMLFAMMCGLTGLVFGGKVSTLWVIIATFAAQETAQRMALRESKPRFIST